MAAWPGALVFCWCSGGSRALCGALAAADSCGARAPVHGGTLHVHDRPPVEADWATAAADSPLQAAKRAQEEVEEHGSKGARQGES